MTTTTWTPFRICTGERPTRKAVEPEAEHVQLARLIMAEVPRSNGSLDARVLSLLVLLEGGPVLVGEVARALGISQASATAISQRACKLGYVEKQQKPAAHPTTGSSRRRGYNSGTDARLTSLTLTPRGHRMRRQRRGGGA